MALSIDQLRQLARTETRQLLNDLEALQPEQWQLPTALPGWRVLDVLVHLAQGTEIHTGLVINGLKGRHEPPWELAPDVDPDAYYRQLLAQEAVKGPGANLTHFREAAERYDVALAQVDDVTVDTLAWFHGWDAPIGFIIATRLFDLLVHSADIRRAAGITPWFSAEASRFAGAFATEAIPQFFAIERTGSATGTIAQVIDGVRSDAVLRADALQPGDGSAVADATIETDGGTWALLTWGRLPLDAARREGLVRISGDETLLARYLGAMNTP